MPDVQHANGPRQPLLLFTAKRLFTVGQTNNRLAPVRIASLKVNCLVDEDSRLAVDRLALAGERHLGPQAFVLRTGSVLFAFLIEHLIQNVVRRADETIHTIGATDAGHTLLVRFLAFHSPLYMSADALLQRAPHRHALAVIGVHQEFAFLVRTRRRLRETKRLRLLGQMLASQYPAHPEFETDVMALLKTFKSSLGET